MVFFGLGKKENIKKPLTDPLDNDNFAALPLQDTLREDPGIPSTPSIMPSDDVPHFGAANKKQEDFYNETNEETKRYPGQIQQQNISQNKDLELISSKLDYIRAAIENLGQRIERLEHVAQQDQDQKYRW